MIPFFTPLTHPLTPRAYAATLGLRRFMTFVVTLSNPLVVSVSNPFVLSPSNHEWPGALRQSQDRPFDRLRANGVGLGKLN
jgi:hypothetical protein